MSRDVLAADGVARVRAMGVEVAVGGAPPDVLEEIAALLRSWEATFTRFGPLSELSRVNRSPGRYVLVSPRFAEVLGLALEAARATGGLVDPTLLPDLERAGYAQSRAGAEPASLHSALAAAPARAPAAPSARAAWRAVHVDGRVVHRPPGLRLDLGGTAKGLAADRAAALLAGQATFAIDAGGDIVVGGASGTPRRVTVAHPLERASAFDFELTRGAVATSGLGTRLWRTPTGYRHHLLDPSTGHSAWTGVTQATAVASSGLEAEVLAKMALLSGPDAGVALLERGGGVLVLDGGEVIVAGALRELAAVAA